MKARTDPDAVAVTRLVKRLGRSWGPNRKLAEEELIAIGPPAVAPLVDAWRSTLRQRVRSRVGYLLASLTLFIVIAVGWIALRNAELHTHPGQSFDAVFAAAKHISHWMVVSICLGMVPTILWGMLMARSEKQRRGIASAATGLADARLANIIAARLRDEGKPWYVFEHSARQEVRDAMARALMGLQQTDVNLLTPSTCRILVSWLKRQVAASPLLYAEEGLAFAILQGLSIVGAAELRPAAERITNIEALTSNQQRLRDEAKLALERLDAWDQQERSGAVLLRGSQPPPVGSDVLVRAAGPTFDSGADLLRAGSIAGPPARASQPVEAPEETLTTVSST